MTTSATDTRDSGRQVGSGATSNSTSTSPDSAARSSRIRPSSDAQALDRGAHDRQRVGRRMGRGQRLDLGGDVDRLAVALVALGRGVALGDDPLGLARLVEHAPPFGQGGLGLGPPLARGRPARRGRVRAGSAPARPARRAASACSTACSATLSRPGLRSPRVFRSWSARSSFLRARLVPRSAPLIEACSRSRRAPSSRDRSLSSKWWTEAVERKKPSVGMPVSSAMTWSARVGSVIDWPS